MCGLFYDWVEEYPTTYSFGGTELLIIIKYELKSLIFIFYIQLYNFKNNLSISMVTPIVFQ